MNPCELVWRLAGFPQLPAPVGEGTCALCGTGGVLHGRLNANFSDHRLLADPTTRGLCGPCAWALAGKPPEALRMWSVAATPTVKAPSSPPNALWAGEHLQLTTRRDLTWPAQVLADPPAGPWLVAVTESAQRHTVPFSRVNYGAGQWTVRLDGTDITSTPAEWAWLLAITARLRAAGFRASDIESGRPPAPALTPERVGVWDLHAGLIRRWAGTPLLHLANLCITKDTLDDYTIRYPI